MKSLFTVFAMFLFLAISCQSGVKKSNPGENSNDIDDTGTDDTDTEDTDTDDTDTEDPDTEDPDTEDTDTEDTDTEDTDTEDTDTEDTDTEDTDTEDIDCISNYETRCYEGDVWWYDSCDNREEEKEICADKCVEGECCISNDTAKCYEGDVWWYDSCDNREEKKEICYHGCDLNDCLDPPDVFPWTDTDTGYQWSEKASGTKNKAQALAYCTGLGVNWRLPTIGELRTLIQHCPDTETGGTCGIADDCVPLTYDNCWNSGCSGCSEEADGRYSKLGHSESLWSSSNYEGVVISSLFVKFSNANVSNAGNAGLLSAVCIKTD